MSDADRYARLPLTIAERSPFDGIRLRWGGFGTVALGVGLLFAGPAGVVLGIVAAALGVATLVLSQFGACPWYDIPTPQRYVVGTGALLGYLTLIFFLGAFIVVGWIITMVASQMA